MTPAEMREVVADLTDETPTIMPDGRMRCERMRAAEWRPAGVHRKGFVLSDVGFGPGEARETAHVLLADVHWYETALEWFERGAN